jgi:hypothetical protein
VVLSNNLAYASDPYAEPPYTYASAGAFEWNVAVTGTATYTLAASFETGALGSYALESVTVSLYRYSGSGEPTLQVYGNGTALFPASAGQPSGLVGTLAYPGEATDFGLTDEEENDSRQYRHYTFTPTAAIALDPSTVYWVVLSTGSSAFNWAYHDGSSPPNEGIGYLGTSGENGGGGWNTRSGDPYLMHVLADGPPTPEVPLPASVLLLGSALATLALRRRRAAG